MNLTKREPFQKGVRRKSGNQPTASDRAYWERVRALGCMAKGCAAANPEIHHTGTGGGGRKDHMQVIGLCRNHHTGPEGIHTLSRRVWQPVYGFEQELLERVVELLGR